MKAITVYCSSSARIDPAFLDAGDELGRAIAAEGWTLVYGGNHIGMMARLADGARANGGKVVGVTPQVLVDKGISDPSCDELVVTSDMRQRKALMESRGNGFVALPGGLGTLEELFEIIVGRQLRLHAKPIVLLNINGYYDPFLQMLQRGIEQNFIKAKALELFHCTAMVADAIQFLRAHFASAG